MPSSKQYRIEEVLPTREAEPEFSCNGLSSCLLVGSKVYVLGELFGYEHVANWPIVAVYDLQEKVWQQAEITGSEKPVKYSHASFLINDRIYLHGGCSSANVLSPDLFYLDLISYEWTKCKTSDVRPNARYTHSGDYLERLAKFVIFGGFAGGRCLDELWVLHVDVLKWKQVEAKGKSPTARNGHSSCVVGENIFIFGGRSPGVVEDDVYLLDCTQSRYVWSKVFAGQGIYRCFASLVYRKGELLLFGGYDENSRNTADLFVLQAPHYIPSKGKVMGSQQVDSFRSYAHTAILSSDDMYIFDGARASFNPLRLQFMD